MELQHVKQNSVYGLAALGTVAAAGTVGCVVNAIVKNTELARNPSALFNANLLCGRANQVAAGFALASILVVGGAVLFGAYQDWSGKATSAKSDEEKAYDTAVTAENTKKDEIKAAETAMNDAKKAMDADATAKGLFEKIAAGTDDAAKKTAKEDALKNTLCKTYIEAEENHTKLSGELSALTQAVADKKKAWDDAKAAAAKPAPASA